jgi:hypothetical protein
VRLRRADAASFGGQGRHKAEAAGKEKRGRPPAKLRSREHGRPGAIRSLVLVMFVIGTAAEIEHVE